MKIMVYILFFGLFCLFGLLVLACLFRAFGFLLSSFSFLMNKLPEKVKKEKIDTADDFDELRFNFCSPEMESIKVGVEDDVK